MQKTTFGLRRYLAGFRRYTFSLGKYLGISPQTGFESPER
jgi:hypothetical protein